MRVLRALQLLVLAAAAGAFLFPPSPSWVDRVYGGSWYPAAQATLTRVSNTTSIPLFDIVLCVGALVLAVGGGWCWRATRRTRSVRPLLRALTATATLLAGIYLWFLLAWGLNYQRAALEDRIGFDQSRVTPAALRSLAERAVGEANRTYEEAHVVGFAAIDAVPAAVVSALHAVEQSLGRPQPTVPARPKQSLLTPFFRASSVSGMLAPLFLETLLNPDLTGPERPLVLAHEWAHLAGYAPEADASFVGVLTALRAEVPAQYSAWLFLVSESAQQLDPVTRTLVLGGLAAGPRRDLADISARLRVRIESVERVSWATYDRMLKSQGVVQGIHSYSRVVQLLVGSGALEARP